MARTSRGVGAIALAVGAVIFGSTVGFAPSAQAASIPQLCSKDAKRDDKAGAVRCFNLRTASAVWRAKEAYEFAIAQKDLGNWVDPQTVTVSKLKKDYDSAVSAAKKAVSTNTVENSCLDAVLTGERSMYVAEDAAKALGSLKDGFYSGLNGDAAKAAREARDFDSYCSDDAAATAHRSVDLDQKEAAAVEAYRKAGWVVD